MVLGVLMAFCVSSLWAAEFDFSAWQEGVPPCAQDQVSLVKTRLIRIANVDKKGNACWGSCTLSLDRDGNILKGTYVDCSGKKAQIVGGKLSVSDFCEVQGTIVTKTETLKITRGAIVNNEVVLGVAAEDESVLELAEE